MTFTLSGNVRHACTIRLMFTTVLEEKEREQRKKMREQYSRQKSSAVWSSAYNEEFQAKYKQQQAEFEQELAERERLKAVDTGVNLNDTPVTKEYKIGSLIARYSSSIPFAFYFPV